MANTAKKKGGLCLGDLTIHELDVLLAYRTKLEARQGVDILLGFEEARKEKLSAPVINMGFAVHRAENFYKQFSETQKRISMMDTQIGDYMKQQTIELEKRVHDLRTQYNRLFEEQ